MKLKVATTVNGRRHEHEVEPRLLLVHHLRDNLGLTGTHIGCDTSQCGACTILVDGKAVKSCTMFAVQAEGRSLTTIEGMAKGDELHPIQQAFWDEHGLITGHGHYIDDFVRPLLAYAAFVRSPHAHARIKSIDVTDASKAPGVTGVYTARDFKGQLAGTHPAAPAFVAEKKYVPERFPIAEKEVCYQGEIVAAVLAETKGQAADAANMIQVEYEEQPAVMDHKKGPEKGRHRP